MYSERYSFIGGLDDDPAGTPVFRSTFDGLRGLAGLRCLDSGS
jgi:hypothetical protein